jgi:hypothetical protein
MWIAKFFKTKEKMNAWLERHAKNIQWYEIFINNEYGLHYRVLRKY